MNIDEIVKQLMNAKYAYYNDSPIMSDIDYDTLEEELTTLDPTNNFFSIVGSPTIVGNKRNHKIPMGSLSKVKIDDGGVDTIVENFLRRNSCMVSYKLDGISVSMEYVDGELKHALTRGDGFIGEVIPNAIEIQNIHSMLPNKFTGSLRGEIVMTYEDFDIINDEFESDDDKFSNPRNAVSGIARKDDTPYRKYLRVLYYDVETERGIFETKYGKFIYLEQLVGDYVVPYFTYTGKEIYEFRGFCNHMDDTRKDLPYMIDGLVIEINDIRLYKSMGVTDNKPKGALALKFNAVAETTHMTDVVWQVGSTGSLTPVAEFTPVLIDGSIVRRASLHNYDIFMDWGFHDGDEVRVQKNNDIIPQIKERIDREPPLTDKYVIPTHCPVCDSELELIKVAKTTNLTCMNPMCMAKVTASVKKWATKSGMTSKGVGDAFFKAYVDHWMGMDDRDEYNVVAGLYSLTIDDIIGLSDRYKTKSATNIYNAIQSSTNIKLMDFYGGLNIHGCGSRTFKKIVDASNIDTSKRECVPELYTYCMMSDISSIDGIGDITSKLIKKSLPKLHNTIFLLDSFTKIISEEIKSTNRNQYSYLFTGKITTLNPDTNKNYKRKELEQLVVDKNHIASSSVNSDLDYLVTSDLDSTSSKMKKARKLGVEIISEDEFFKQMNNI